MADALESGSTLTVGQKITSENGENSLELQADGNLVLSTHGGPVWATGTNGSGATRVDLQADGNLVLYKDDNSAVWASQTHGSNAHRLLVGNNRSVALIGSDGAEVWSAGTTDSSYVAPAAPAPAAEPAPQAAPAPAAQTYTVAPGDTLWAIAERYYGDGNQYHKIAQASGIANPDLIHPGQVLTIPA